MSSTVSSSNEACKRAAAEVIEEFKSSLRWRVFEADLKQELNLNFGSDGIHFLRGMLDKYEYKTEAHGYGRCHGGSSVIDFFKPKLKEAAKHQIPFIIDDKSSDNPTILDRYKASLESYAHGEDSLLTSLARSINGVSTEDFIEGLKSEIEEVMEDVINSELGSVDYFSLLEFSGILALRTRLDSMMVNLKALAKEKQEQRNKEIIDRSVETGKILFDFSKAGWELAVAAYNTWYTPDLPSTKTNGPKTSKKGTKNGKANDSVTSVTSWSELASSMSECIEKLRSASMQLGSRVANAPDYKGGDRSEPQRTSKKSG